MWAAYHMRNENKMKPKFLFRICGLVAQDFIEPRQGFPKKNHFPPHVLSGPFYPGLFISNPIRIGRNST